MFIEDRHGVEYGESPQVISTVPGVTTFAGEFSMYCQGYALCGTNDKELIVSLSRRSDSFIRVLNTVSNDRKKFGLTGIKYRKEDRWGNYVKGMILELQRFLDIPGLNVTLGGNLLNCDGKVLSAALGVGIGTALYSLMGKEPNYSIIASCCWQSSSKFCGELFNLHLVTAMLYSKKDCYMLFDTCTATFKLLPNPFENSSFSLVLANGNIPPLAMREELYGKHELVQDIMEKLSLLYPKVRFRDFPVDELSDRLLPVEEETRIIGGYVFEEREITLLLEKAFINRDPIQIGKILARLGKGLRDKLELTCPELDWLSKRSLETTGCLGSSIVYNGGGGYIAMVMGTSSVKKYASKIDEYEKIFGFKAISFEYTPLGGVCIQKF